MKLDGPWPGRLALAGILALAAVLRLMWLDREGWGNQYYAATVQSMLTGWKAFLFACYDPECFVTVDKPPLGLWVQAAFAKVLGLNGVALILPQALAGVASVGVLYAMVRRAFGVSAGLIAALALAVMPISVATDRNNTMDSQLVLVTLLAAFAAIRAVETGRARWLMLSFGLIGLGFEIKMLQAYLVLPAIGLLYLVAARTSLFRRVAHLAAGAALMIAISFAWPLAVDLTSPADRPYVGGSRDNSVVELITGHNGLARLGAFGRGVFGRAQPAASRPAVVPAGGPGGPAQGTVIAIGGGGPGGESGEPGPLRLFNTQLAGQASWLLPLAIFGAAAIALRATWRPRPDARATFVLLFGVWVIAMGAFFSATSGIFHRYYLVMLAPAIAALLGAGAMEMWREYRRRANPAAVVLSLALATTAAVQTLILAPYPEWAPRLVPFLVVSAFGALALALVALIPARVPRLFAPAVFAASLLAQMSAPMAWAAMPVAYAPGSMLPAAGPDRDQGPIGARITAPRGPLAPAAPLRQLQGTAGPGPGRADPVVAAHLVANRGSARWLVAVASAGVGSPLMLDTKIAVMALGGFGGGDRILDAAGFAAMVRRGDVRFVLSEDLGPVPGGPPPAGLGAPGPQPPGDDVMRWARVNCAPVPGLPRLLDCGGR